MGLISALSVRAADPQAHITVFSDSATLARLRRSRHQLLEIADEFQECPAQGSPARTSRSIKTTLLERLESDFIYLDVDTIVLQPIADRLQEPYPLQVALDRTPGVADPCFPVWFAPQFERLGWPWPTAHYYNSGVMIVRAGKASEELFEERHRRWHQFLSCGLHYDQPALNSSIHGWNPLSAFCRFPTMPWCAWTTHFGTEQKCCTSFPRATTKMPAEMPTEHSTCSSSPFKPRNRWWPPGKCAVFVPPDCEVAGCLSASESKTPASSAGAFETSSPKS